MDIVVKEDVRQTSEVPDASSANSSSEWQSTVSQTANKSSNAVVDSSQDDDLGMSPTDFVNNILCLQTWNPIFVQVSSSVRNVTLIATHFLEVTHFGVLTLRIINSYLRLSAFVK